MYSARHLQQRVEVRHWRESTQPTGHADTPMPMRNDLIPACLAATSSIDLAARNERTSRDLREGTGALTQTIEPVEDRRAAVSAGSRGWTGTATHGRHGPNLVT